MKTYKLLAILTICIASCSSEQDSSQAEQNISAQARQAQSSLNPGANVLVEQSQVVKSTREINKLLELAELGDTSAMNLLAWKYKNAEGVEKNLSVAAQWYKKAAEKGDSAAQDNLGVMYRDGIGLTKMPAEAAKWFELSAKQGNSQGQGNLGQLYFDGNGITRDMLLAYAWSAIAVKNGNSGFAKSNMDTAKTRLKPDQIVKADEIVAQWKIGQTLSNP